MELGLDGKVVIITGGSKGIGLEAAIQFANEGAYPVLIARDKGSLAVAKDKILNETGVEAMTFSADVKDSNSYKDIFKDIMDTHGRIDSLINNAGTAAAHSFEDVDAKSWKDDLDLKLVGAIEFSKLALPFIKKQGGSIVNVTAVMAKTPPANSLPSTVSRAAGLALTKAMSKDLGAFNVRVNAVCIGLIRSDQIEKKWQETHSHLSWEEYSQVVGEAIPLRRIGETSEAAKMIVFLSSEAASYVSGTAINIDGGFGHTL
ncbi:SDR family oxidoreductase [Chryseomicrobium palamuruense]